MLISLAGPIDNASRNRDQEALRISSTLLSRDGHRAAFAFGLLVSRGIDGAGQFHIVRKRSIIRGIWRLFQIAEGKILKRLSSGAKYDLVDSSQRHK